MQPFDLWPGVMEYKVIRGRPSRSTIMKIRSRLHMHMRPVGVGCTHVWHILRWLMLSEGHDTLESFPSKVAFERKFRVCHENFWKFSLFKSSFQWLAQVLFWKVFFRKPSAVIGRESDDDDDEIAYFTVRWKTRASFVYRTKNIR